MTVFRAKNRQDFQPASMMRTKVFFASLISRFLFFSVCNTIADNATKRQSYTQGYILFKILGYGGGWSLGKKMKKMKS